MSQGEGVIRKGFDAVNRHDVNGLYELYSPNVVMYSPQHPEGMRGRESVRRQFEAYLDAFPDMKIKISNIVAKDDVGWFELQIVGTHKGTIHMEAGPVPPTNMLVNIRAALFWRFSRGLIIEERSYFDSASLMRQLRLETSLSGTSTPLQG